MTRYVKLSKWLTAHHMPPPALPIVCGYAPLIEKLEHALLARWEADTRLSLPEGKQDEHIEAEAGGGPIPGESSPRKRMSGTVTPEQQQETALQRPQPTSESAVEDNGEGLNLKAKQKGADPKFNATEFIEAAFNEDQMPVETTPARSFSREISNSRKDVNIPQQATGDADKGGRAGKDLLAPGDTANQDPSGGVSMPTAEKAGSELAGDRARGARPKDAEEGQGEHRDSVESRAKSVAGRASPAAKENQVSGHVELVNNDERKARERGGNTPGRGAAGHADGSTAGQPVL